MAGERKQVEGGESAAGLKGRVENQWLKIKEHMETYPYVWGSYILVYGGLGAYITYRWRKLRQTENRVQVLQERLWKHVKAEESASASGSDSAGLSNTKSR